MASRQFLVGAIARAISLGQSEPSGARSARSKRAAARAFALTIVASRARIDPWSSGLVLAADSSPEAMSCAAHWCPDPSRPAAVASGQINRLPVPLDAAQAIWLSRLAVALDAIDAVSSGLNVFPCAFDRVARRQQQQRTADGENCQKPFHAFSPAASANHPPLLFQFPQRLFPPIVPVQRHLGGLSERLRIARTRDRASCPSARRPFPARVRHRISGRHATQPSGVSQVSGPKGSSYAAEA